MVLGKGRGMGGEGGVGEVLGCGKWGVRKEGRGIGVGKGEGGIGVEGKVSEVWERYGCGRKGEVLVLGNGRGMGVEGRERYW